MDEKEIQEIASTPEATPEEIARAVALDKKYKELTSQKTPPAIKKYRDRMTDEQWAYFLKLPICNTKRLDVLKHMVRELEDQKSNTTESVSLQTVSEQP